MKFKYKNKNSIPDLNEKGIYFIFMNNEIEYIGMSCNNKEGLKSRLKQFDEALNGIKGRHSGGERFFKEYGKEKVMEEAEIKIITFKDNNQSPAAQYKLNGDIKQAECYSIAEFIEKTGQKPRFNIH
jgi:hypothetical protein